MPETSQKVQNSFSEQDAAYVHNLSDTGKMELMVETSYYLFRGASLLTLGVVVSTKVSFIVIVSTKSGSVQRLLNSF